VLPLLLDTLWWRLLEGFFHFFPLSLVLWAFHCKWESQSGLTRLINSSWFLLSTVQVAIVTWSNSLPVHARWSDLLLFSPGGSYIVLQLQLWLVSSSPSKVGQSIFCTVLSPVRLAQWSNTALLWEVGLLPHSCSQPFYFSYLYSLRVQLLAPSLLSRADSAFHPIPIVGVRLQFAVYAFLFCLGGSICLGAALD
jgi:hypothetical protein